MPHHSQRSFETLLQKIPSQCNHHTTASCDRWTGDPTTLSAARTMQSNGLPRLQAILSCHHPRPRSAGQLARIISDWTLRCLYLPRNTSQTPEEAAHAAACAVDHTHSHFNYEDLFCCDLPCPDMSFCDPSLRTKTCSQTCTSSRLLVARQMSLTPHMRTAIYHMSHVQLPPRAHSPCEDPSCSEPAEAECCEDPYCEDISACCPSTMPGTATNPTSIISSTSTTPITSMIINITHQTDAQHVACQTFALILHITTATGGHDSFPNRAHTAWHGHMHPPHVGMAPCSSGLSIEPLLQCRPSP